MHLPAIIAAVCLMTCPHGASAQVYKCQGADGKVVYSQAPCPKADNKEQRVRIMASPPPDADAAPVRPVPQVASNPAPPPAAPDNPPANQQNQQILVKKLPKAFEPAGPTTAEIIADCEKNRGTRCNTAAEINQRRMEQTPLTKEQQRELQDMRAARAQERMSREMMRR